MVGTHECVPYGASAYLRRVAIHGNRSTTSRLRRVAIHGNRSTTSRLRRVTIYGDRHAPYDQGVFAFSAAGNTSCTRT
jgi:hypothetical protein